MPRSNLSNLLSRAEIRELLRSDRTISLDLGWVLESGPSLDKSERIINYAGAPDPAAASLVQG